MKKVVFLLFSSFLTYIHLIAQTTGGAPGTRPASGASSPTAYPSSGGVPAATRPVPAAPQQQGTVLSGSVRDSATGRPMPGISVFLNGTSKGTVTRPDGTFSLGGIPPGRYEIIVSAIGYQTYTLAISTRNLPQDLRISLHVKAAELAAANPDANPSSPSTTPASTQPEPQKPSTPSFQEVFLIIKADVSGSVEAVTNAISALGNSEVRPHILRTGVGPITALTFRAGVDDPNRFASSRDVAAHFGLTPRLFESGATSYSGHITGIGDRAVRAALYSAASSLINVSKSKSELGLWARDLARRKGFKLAATACARKMAVLLHRMWITSQPFKPEGLGARRR